MSFTADLHVHSLYSRATSKKCNLEGLHYAAQRKGIRVVGTGDITHPEWFSEIQSKLAPSLNPGLYYLKEEYARPLDEEVPTACRSEVNFMLTGEISSIYKLDGQVRKVHTIVKMPDLETAERLNARLEQIGNIRSDGRPILGLDPRDLLEILLEINPEAYAVPAHIWTPWFSVFGSKSGFESITACFRDLEEHIFAVETGLSSDPPMNWRLSDLDRFTLVSNSDLHSPDNLGRNATVFHCDPDFFQMRDALRYKDPERCGGTLDMFPQEGKYHMDGHRKCDICLEPEESLAKDKRCPTCGRPLTLGVLHRVVALADRQKGATPSTALPFRYIIPLREILGEIHERGPGTKTVSRDYEKLLAQHGSELNILLDMPVDSDDGITPKLLPEALRRLRNHEVIRESGFDGEYGSIKVFKKDEKDQLLNQAVFSGMPEPIDTRRKAPSEKEGCISSDEVPKKVENPSFHFSGSLTHSGNWFEQESGDGRGNSLQLFDEDHMLYELTPAQREAVTTVGDHPALVVAGPGSGKTRTLTYRIAHLLRCGGVTPEKVLAITFTNRAADEMHERLQYLVGALAEKITICTFHAFSLKCLRENPEASQLPPDCNLIDREEATELLQRSSMNYSRGEAKWILELIENAYREDLNPSEQSEDTHKAQQILAEEKAVLLDSLIPRCVDLFKAYPQVLKQLPYQWFFVDEYQDINATQYRLVKQLTPDGKRLFAIGDPDQAIYGFRGADRSYFLRFTEDFPQTTVYQLQTNFRSTARIVSSAHQIIAPYVTQMSVFTKAHSARGIRIQTYEAPTAAAEAEFIAHEVEKMLGGTAFFSVDSERVGNGDTETEIGLQDIAVLVRSRQLMPPVIEALERLGLPVQQTGENPLVQDPVVREIIEELRSVKQETSYESTAEIFSRMRENACEDRQRTFDKLQAAAETFDGTVTDFLDDLMLRREVDQYDAKAERITVMTLHAAKGLEFPLVFIPACEEGIIPWTISGEGTDIEEECRLLYVGMTRARQMLYMSSAAKRTIFGKTVNGGPSRFLKVLQEELQNKHQPSRKAEKKTAKQLEFDFL